ncbi:MAG: TRAP transporter small permease [Pelistega sp.]|nr:TRAP transporter small permease [Pelistega sp.]
MKTLEKIWAQLEEILVIISLSVMTLVTFVYVLVNNLYDPFFSLADSFPSMASFFESLAMFCMTMAQEMTWSNAVTKACFGVLIFLGTSYGVRTAGHIGIDALVKRFGHATQRKVSIVACLFCLLYAVIIFIASYDWVKAMFIADVGAEDLHAFGIKVWHIGAIVPIAFVLIFFRFLEIFMRLIAGKQTDLGLADEAGDAVKLQDHQE